jgi:hypothetical protein
MQTKRTVDLADIADVVLLADRLVVARESSFDVGGDVDVDVDVGKNDGREMLVGINEQRLNRKLSSASIERLE